MSAPFRDDVVWRSQRAADLEAERVELAAERLAVETRLLELRRGRFAPLVSRLISVVGLSFVVIALAGGYAVGRWVVAERAQECR
jgi:hypothetical protein